MTIFRVGPDGFVSWNDERARCALGKTGIRADKREGDDATPVGRFPLRRVFYRPDKMPAPKTALPVQALSESDGWCDDPADPAYNTFVRLPFAASHERLWRDDSLYDLILVIGHNDDPPIAGRGSAIFVHVAGPNFEPTAGCVSLRTDDLTRLLAAARPGDVFAVEES